MSEKIVISCPHCDKKINVPRDKHIRFICPNCNKELEFDSTIKSVDHESDINEDEDTSRFGDSILNFLSWILAIPLFIIAHKLIPEFDWPVHFDRILMALIIIGLLRLLLKEFRILILLSFLGAIVWLSIGSYKGTYGFVSIHRDYKALVYSLISSPHPEEVIIQKIVPIKNKSEIIDAIDYDNPAVRNYAVSLTKDFQTYAGNYSEYRTTIQAFAIFNAINQNWNYVHDPVSREYFAKASETINHLSGDCDDHSILMAACIKSIGGVMRLVLTDHHIYPELLIGSKKDLEKVNYLIKRKLFRNESMDQSLSYHIDEYNQVWLNLDYTAKYPGGPFMSEEIRAILTLNE